MLKRITRNLALFLFSFFLFSEISYLKAQTYDDGPIFLEVKVRDVWVTYNPPSDASLNFGGQIGFNPDNFTFFFWARDVGSGTWQGTGNCLTDNFDPPLNSDDFNETLLSQTYGGATVPQFFEVKMDAWENDCGTDGISGLGSAGNCVGDRCTYQTNCCCVDLPFVGCQFSTNDDYPCFADPFATDVDYREGPPCSWHDHGYMTTTNCANTVYEPRIESYWRYTRGEDCTEPIELGAIASGDTISHFNSNECYNNTFGTPGKDVVYSFEITDPMGVRVSACGGSGAFNRTVYLNDGSCNSTTLASASGACAELSYSLCVPGTYYVIVSGTDAAGEGTFTLDLFEDIDFTYEATIEKTDISCNGANDGTAAVVINGGNPPYSYVWTPGGSNDSILTGLGEGTIEVEVTDSDNCVVTASATFTDPDPIVIDSIVPTDVSCGGATDGEALVYAQGGSGDYDFLWSTSPIQQVTNPAVFLAAGNYMVTVTDENDCEASESVLIGSSSPIQINTVDFSHISCFGNNDGYVEVEVAGGEEPYVFAWSNGSDTNSAADLEPGQVDLVMTDADGCVEQETFIINEPSLLESNILSVVDVSCAGGNDGVAGVIAFGGTPPYNYEWLPGGNNQELLVNATAEDYSIVITDANDCETVDSVSIQEPEPIATSVSGFDPDCTAEDPDNASVSLDVSGGSGNLDILWSDGSSSMDLFNVPGGKYIVFIHDENDCFAIDSIQLEACPQDTVLVPGGDLHFVRAPNAFAPEGSGQNTHFNIKSMNAHTVEVSIYNRWGEEVYYHQNILNTSNGWDGTHRGSNAPMGSYVYHLRVEYINGEFREKTGSVVLIR